MQRRPTAHFLALLHVAVWVEGQHLWRGTSGVARRSIAAAASVSCPRLPNLRLSRKLGNLGQEKGGGSDSACDVVFDRNAPLSCAAYASRVADRCSAGGSALRTREDAAGGPGHSRAAARERAATRQTEGRERCAYEVKHAPVARSDGHMRQA